MQFYGRRGACWDTDLSVSGIGPVVKSLIERARRVIPPPADKWTVIYAFFSRSGFAPDARPAVAGQKSMWVTLEQIDSALR